jgi:hypothetical protein
VTLVTAIHSQEETNQLFKFIWPETQVTASKVFRNRHRSVNTPANDAINDTKAIQIELNFNMTALQLYNTSRGTKTKPRGPALFIGHRPTYMTNPRVSSRENEMKSQLTALASGWQERFCKIIVLDHGSCRKNSYFVSADNT